jgi:hypothetical protein
VVDVLEETADGALEGELALHPYCPTSEQTMTTTA